MLILPLCAQQAKQQPKALTPTDPISGSWDGYAQFAGVPAVHIKLELTLKGKVVTGVVTSPEALPITDGSWADDKLVLHFARATMSASLKGGQLVGEMLNDPGVKGTWEARRAAATKGNGPQRSSI
jgi:hypothetical protein